jgi:hypothetical protein
MKEKNLRFGTIVKLLLQGGEIIIIIVLCSIKNNIDVYIYIYIYKYMMHGEEFWTNSSRLSL